MTAPSTYRLSGPKAFSNVFQQAMVSADASFKVLARNTGQPNARLGMAVSKKVDSRAVQRNRLKRVIRESFRAHYFSDFPHTPVDVVVLPRRQAVTISNGQLFEKLEQHWHRIDQKMNAMSSITER
jgi:ribonuclease P protein component